VCRTVLGQSPIVLPFQVFCRDNRKEVLGELDNVGGEEKIFALKIIKVYTKSIDECGGNEMQTAKLFQNGRSQAVRLPKEFRIPGNEVKIFKKGNQVILEPIATTWDPLFESLNEFPEDFMKDGRNQPGMQERESI